MSPGEAFGVARSGSAVLEGNVHVRVDVRLFPVLKTGEHAVGGGPVLAVVFLSQFIFWISTGFEKIPVVPVVKLATRKSTRLLVATGRLPVATGSYLPRGK